MIFIKFIVSFAACLVLLILIDYDRFRDPFLWSDDFLVLFPRPGLFFVKTLEEARWLNYFWAWRGFSAPSQTFYAAYLATWALTCALVSARLFADDKTTLRVVIFATALAVTPQMSLLGVWSSITLVANTVLLTAIIVITFINAYWRHFVFPVAVALGAVSYPGHSFVLLGFMLALQTHDRDLSAARGIVLLFLVGMCGGTIAGFVLNYSAHGVFGVQLASWRVPDPVPDQTSIFQKLNVLSPMFPGHPVEDELRTMMACAVMAMPVLLFWMAHSDRPPGLRALCLGLAVSISLLIGLVVSTSAQIPVRSTAFVWIFVVCGFAIWPQSAMRLGNAPKHGALGLAMVVIGVLLWRLAYGPEYVSFQTASKEMVARIAEVHSNARRILLFGGPADYPELGVMEDDATLEFRIEYLTGTETIYCGKWPGKNSGLGWSEENDANDPWVARLRRHADLCRGHAPELLQIKSHYPAAGSIVPIGNDTVAVRFRND